MSKALVIKGANFSANKIETITITEVIPCTGIALSDSTHAFTAIGATKTLTATVTPNDTTESVVWSTSNANVATVENGVVTCVGVGSATITATCGSQSATCAITSTLTINLKTGYAYDVGYSAANTDIANGKDYVTQYGSGSAKAITFASSTPTTSGYFGYSSDGHTAFGQSTYPVMLPLNTSKITFTGVDKRSCVSYMDSTKKTSASNLTASLKGTKALADRVFVSPTNHVCEYTIPSLEGLDSILFAYEYNNSVSDLAGTETVTFS